MLHILGEELTQPLVEAAHHSDVERDPNERRRHALRDGKDVEAARARGAAVVALEEQPPVAFDEDAEDARLGAKPVIECARVEARASLRCRHHQQQRRRCGRCYSERSSAHSDIGT